MKNWITVFILAMGFLSAKAQNKSYSLANVPEVLKSKAEVVIHQENIELEVESLEKASCKVHKVYTVLNEEGKNALLFNEYSSKNLTLDDAEIKVYDQNGKQTARYKKKEMSTVAVGEGLIEDGYVTYFQIIPPSYPVTVELNYELKLKSTLLIPAYDFIHPKEAVIESSFTAKLPAEIGFRYKSVHNSLTPSITEDGKYKIYKWSVKNLAPVEDEEGSVSGRNKLPYVDMVTDQFSHYGFRGDLSTWKNFGLWIRELYQGLDSLSPAKQEFFRKMVSDAPTETEKLQRIYSYMQNNFRYVSIQLGIGGLRPFSAIFTDQKKYGDCKALSNYMKAALKSVGINSHVAIINAEYNQEPVDPDFPANNFNHVILCVPGKKDSTWLECTSSTAEFGKLGTFTENRNALLITDLGGVLVSTPRSESATNTSITHTILSMEDDLSAVSETRMDSKGEYSEMMAEMMKEKKDDQKEFLVLYLGYKQPDDFELNTVNNGTGHQSKIKMVIRKLPEFNSGSKYFINPRINKIWAAKLPPAENRKLDYYFRFPFEKTDTTVIKLSSNLKPDVLPKEKNLNTPYVNYSSSCWYNEKENAIYTVTRLVLKKHKVLAADFASVRSTLEEIKQDDAQRVIVKKLEGVSEKKAF